MNDISTELKVVKQAYSWRSQRQKEKEKKKEAIVEKKGQPT